MLFLTVSCDRRSLEAKIWFGKSTEAGIVRDEVCSPEMVADGVCQPNDILERFLPASSPTFDDFRCMKKADLDELIKEAQRRCR